MRILITGANGQLGREIVKSFKGKFEIIPKTKKDFNLLNPEKCKKYILKTNPDWVINTAAYTNVNLAEEEQIQALKINGYGPQIIAQSLKESGGKMIQISTDYVFDGFSKKPYKVDDKKNPINSYGRSKEYGENAVERILGSNNQVVILRTSWLMSHRGNNFVKTILNLLSKKDEISVIKDQIGSLTSTYSLAKACEKIIEKFSYSKKGPPLRMHWSNLGSASWFEIATKIKDISLDKGLIYKNSKINPSESNKFLSIAKRPIYSVLDCQSTYKILNFEPYHWEDELSEIIVNIKNDLK